MSSLVRKKLTPTVLAVTALLVFSAVSVVLALDSAAPVITINSPAEGSVVKGSTASISFTVSDPDLIANSNYFVKVNGVVVPSNIQFRGHWESSYDSCTGSTYDYWVIDGYDQATVTATATGLKNGLQNVEIQAADRVGNISTKTINFSVNLAPVISGLEPVNGTNISKVPTIKAVIADPDGPAKDLVGITLIIDDKQVVYEVSYDAAGNTVVTYTSAVLANDAYHSVALSVVDSGGSTASATWKFYAMSLGQNGGFRDLVPADASVVNTATPTIKASLSNSAGIFDPGNISMAIDGGAPFRPTVSGVDPEYRITYTPPAALKEGTHTVNLSVYNTVYPDKPESVTWGFKIAIPPVVTKTQPTATVTNSTPVVAGYVTDNEIVARGEIKIDGQPVTPKLEYVQTKNASGRSYYTKDYARISAAPALPLADGSHTVSMVAYDAAGNSVATEWKFNVTANYGPNYPDMPLTSETTCWKCHTDILPLAQSTYSGNIGGNHPEVPACYGCHTKTIWGSRAFQSCTACHYDVKPAGNYPSYLSYRHTSDGYYAFANITNVRHPIKDVHLSSTTGCEQCHARILTQEHFRPGRTDKNGNPINCETCHTGTSYLGEQISTNQSLRIQNPTVGTYPDKIWNAPQGQVFSKVYLDALMQYGMYYDIYVQYPGKGWGFVRRISGPSGTEPSLAIGQWLDLPVPANAIKTKLLFNYSNGTNLPDAHVDVPSVRLVPTNAEYQKIQNAIANHDTSCGACHTQTDHETVHNSGLDDKCQSCHNKTLTTEHLSNTTTAGKNFTCDTCHSNSSTPVKRAIANNNLNCTACHTAGHNLNFVDQVPKDIPLYEGYQWTNPMEASIFRGEPSTPAGYETGQMVTSSRRTDVTVDQVWNYYNDLLTSGGWLLKSSAPAAGATMFSGEFEKMGRAVTVKCYNTETGSGLGQPLAAGYRIEIWYK